MNKFFILKQRKEKENGIKVINNVITVRNLAIMQKTVKQRNQINRKLIARRIIVIKQILMLKKKKLLHLLQMQIT
jgi:hypothetical protein